MGFLLVIIAIGNLAQPIEQWSQSSVLLVRYIPLPILRLPEFIVGMALGLIFLRAPRLRYSGLISLCATLIAITVLCSPQSRWTSIAIIPFAVLIVSLAYQRGLIAKALSTRMLVLFGSASYAVYLLQLPIRIYTRLVVSMLPIAPHDLDAFLSPCLLLSMSVMVFLFWEEPARKFLRRALGLKPRWKWPYFPTSKPLSDASVIKSPNDHLL